MSSPAGLTTKPLRIFCLPGEHGRSRRLPQLGSLPKAHRPHEAEVARRPLGPAFRGCTRLPDGVIASETGLGLVPCDPSLALEYPTSTACLPFGAGKGNMPVGYWSLHHS